MPAQTESLIKLLDGNSAGRGKATVRIPSFKYRRTANEMNYRFRINSVQAAASVSDAGQTIRVQLPAYSSIVGEQYLKVSLNACTGGTYKQYPGAQLIKSIKLRHSDVAYEVLDVKETWAYLISKCRDKEDKEQRKKIFGNSAADAAAAPTDLDDGSAHTGGTVPHDADVLAALQGRGERLRRCGYYCDRLGGGCAHGLAERHRVGHSCRG